MGWSYRGKWGRYYTRSRRENGQVVREYIGCGIDAAEIAASDLVIRKQRELNRQAEQTELQEINEIDLAVRLYTKQVETTLREILNSLGYHQHARGRWRRQRRK